MFRSPRQYFVQSFLIPPFLGAVMQQYSERVYLNVPYAEKESAKQMGARWCPERRQWWVRSVGAAPGVHRWLVPGRQRDQAKEADDFLRRTGKTKKPKRPKLVRATGKSPTVTPRTDFSLPTCACLSPPWEHCEHTVRTEPDPFAAEFDAQMQHIRSIAHAV